MILNNLQILIQIHTFMKHEKRKDLKQYFVGAGQRLSNFRRRTEYDSLMTDKKLSPVLNLI